MAPAGASAVRGQLMLGYIDALMEAVSAALDGILAGSGTAFDTAVEAVNASLRAGILNHVVRVA